MRNPRTTVLGYLLLVAAVIHVAIAAIQGNYGNLGIQDVLTALSGVGLINASDGGH